MYRRGAPWESGPRPALVQLVESGRITPEVLTPARAIDLGCGSGADSVYLAERGFDVTGIDFSSVAIDKARIAAEGLDPSQRPTFVVGDLREIPNDDLFGPFDLLFDGGTIDDFPSSVRPSVVSGITRLARPGAVMIVWCFYAHVKDLPLMSFGGPSRFGAPPIEPGEEVALFGEHWDMDRYVPRDAGRYEACFVLTRR